MDGSEKRGNADEMLKREQEKGEEEVLVVEGQEELGLPDTEDEEEQGSIPLITAFSKGMTKVNYVHVCL